MLLLRQGLSSNVFSSGKGMAMALRDLETSLYVASLLE